MIHRLPRTRRYVSDWYDFWTNERFTGGQKVAKACPLDIFPLYVRAGRGFYRSDEPGHKLRH
jgi:alpha-glucosidase (family GH31 glycosyl hydrolase)